jgi:hypothetical protein
MTVFHSIGSAQGGTRASACHQKWDIREWVPVDAPQVGTPGSTTKSLARESGRKWWQAGLVNTGTDKNSKHWFIRSSVENISVYGVDRKH